MANIKLPARFDKKLKINQSLEGIVKKTLGDYGEILVENNLFFFEEYTDHGITHIENILKATNTLITDKTFRFLSCEDISYYILAVILHDLGMHITLDGFNFLLNNGFEDYRDKRLDKFSWKELWDEYFASARRFSGTQLKQIFGDEKTIIEHPKLHNPNLISSFDRKLIGEFLRRNHTRLAYEIALGGFPGQNYSLKFANKLNDNQKKLIGIIARSHGIDLRKAIVQLEDVYGHRISKFPFNCRAPYLMILLRISDYLQIDNSRTSEIVNRTKSFQSPISKIEHEAHISIDSIDFTYQDDPERIYVQATPKNAFLFLKLKKLIKEIQSELDISWAVLGQLYGKDTDKPELKFRRIDSNLEEERFIKNQKYVADKFSLKINVELTSLLISPLYGNNPTYGVRELLQNSLDSCQEMRTINNSNYYKGEIIIELFKNELEQTFFSIIDNGVGMNLDIIKNYFLCVGASYRKSEAWEEKFLDSNLNSKVRRTGRFGIGVLAGFLLGDELMIETRRYDEEFGYSFTITRSSMDITVSKKKTMPIGTKIIVKVSNNSKIKLEADVKQSQSTKKIKKNIDIKDDLSKIKWFEWYRLNSPKIKYKYYGKNVTPNFNTIYDYSKISNEWNSISYKNFESIDWTYKLNNGNYKNYPFICNGIAIENESSNNVNLKNFKTPYISIFDNNGVTPLSLSRNNFIAPLPFLKELEEDICKDFIAYLLTYKVKTKITDHKISLRKDFLNYKGLQGASGSDLDLNLFKNYLTKNYFPKTINKYDFFFNKKGFILNHSYFLQCLKKIDVLQFEKLPTEIYNSKLFPTKEIDVRIDIHNKFVFMNEWHFNKDIVEDLIADQMSVKNKGSIIYTNYRFGEFNNIRKAPFEKITNNNYKSLTWSVFNNQVRGMESVIDNNILNLNIKNVDFILEFQIKSKNNNKSYFHEYFEKYLGSDCIIPYRIIERKQKFPLAFKNLKNYLEKYLS